jgi:uncharacterized membrane protein
MSTLAIVLRFLHIAPAVVAGGATVFARVALLPSLAALPEAERARVKDAIDRRWRIVVMACVTLLLLSGIANFVIYQAPVHKGQPLYHALFGVKFLAALVVFFLASALSGRSKALAGIRTNSRFWVGVTATLVLAIVLISAVLRNIPHAT